jgi:hypothetical protein
MKRFALAAALALVATVMFSGTASAYRYYWGGPYGVTTGGPYRVVPGPVPYSTLMVPATPTTTWIGPMGRVHYVRPYAATTPYWSY